MDNASSTSAFDVDQEMSNEDALGDYSGRSDDMKNQVSSLKEQAAGKATEVKEQVKQQAGELMHRTRDEMKSQLSSQKDRIVDGLSSFAGTLRQAGDQCQTNDMSAPVAEYAHRAAGYVEQFSHELRQRDVDDVIREAEDMARRQPTLFIGASFLIGMGIARFLKSGSPSRHALVPVSTYGTGGGSADMAPNSLRGNMDALPTGERAPTAHNYVPGVGVKSEQRDNTGSSFGGSSFSSGSESSSGATGSGAADAGTSGSGSVGGSVGGTEARSDNGI